MNKALLAMRHIQKYFPGVHALDDCCLELASGEVMALIGENGAGKSTLMKILTGIYEMDSGEILLEGKNVQFHSPIEAQAHGVYIIHQELNLMGDLTVAENIYIGREPMRGFMIDQRKLLRMAQDLLHRLHMNIPADEKVKKLSIAQQQMVEVAKALSNDQIKLLIMDEPTASLTDVEIRELFTFIRQLKAQGVGIIYISHRMEELGQIADRVTVMRDGQYVQTLPASAPVEELIRLMVGRTIYEQPKQRSSVKADAPVVLKVENLCSLDVQNVSFELRKGEILGFAGLMGSGRTETARLLCGADPKLSGSVSINGKQTNLKTPSDAVRAGIGYLSEDRKAMGLCLGLSVADNIALAIIDDHAKGGVIRRRELEAIAQSYVDKLKIKTPGVSNPVLSLSGGNQQKSVLARWLARNCDVLIIDEPTRGIDVGAKSEIYALMAELAAQGKAIIMISSDLPELLRMSDRVLVMSEGKVSGILPIEEATQEKIMTLATM